MISNFRDRISGRLLLWGIVLLVLACIIPSKKSFSIYHNGRKETISRQSDPLVYWGADSVAAVVGVSLLALVVFRSRKLSRSEGDRGSAESLAESGSFGMKVTAAVVAVAGILNVMASPRGFPDTGNLKWLLTLGSGLFGILSIWIAVGIWMRWFWAWRLGFMAIALGAVSFVTQGCFHLPAASFAQKAIIVSACSVSGVMGAAYLSFLWYRQKRWFLDNPVS